MSTLSMRRVSYLIKYLGEFEFICVTILDYDQGTRWVLLLQKKPPSKISCLGTFKRFDRPWLGESPADINNFF
jgi:hypothetical protein